MRMGYDIFHPFLRFGARSRPAPCEGPRWTRRQPASSSRSRWRWSGNNDQYSRVSRFLRCSRGSSVFGCLVVVAPALERVAVAGCRQGFFFQATILAPSLTCPRPLEVLTTVAASLPTPLQRLPSRPAWRVTRPPGGLVRTLPQEGHLSSCAVSSPYRRRSGHGVHDFPPGA